MKLYDQRFGDVRSLVHQKPSTIVFVRLCKALLEMWREAPLRVNEEAVPYLEGYLASWPDEICIHPSFWLPAWTGEQKHSFEPLRFVRVLDLSFQRYGDEIVQHLADNPAFSNVTMLDLTGNSLSLHAPETLVQARHLDTVQELRISQNSLGEAGVITLVSSPVFHKLERLHMWNVLMGDEAAVTLANSPGFTKLTHLRLSENRIGLRGQTALTARFGGIETLDLERNARAALS